MRDNDFPIRMAGQGLRIPAQALRGITPQDVTRQLRYQQAFPKS
jgi:hypothetical protein